MLLGIAVLLSVASQRHQRLEDASIDLQRSLSQQEVRVKDLQQRLENCESIESATPADTGWGVPTHTGSSSSIGQGVPAWE